MLSHDEYLNVESYISSVLASLTVDPSGVRQNDWPSPDDEIDALLRRWIGTDSGTDSCDIKPLFRSGYMREALLNKSAALIGQPDPNKVEISLSQALSGDGLVIGHSYANSGFGEVLVASTAKGICYLQFVDSHLEPLTALQNTFPKAVLLPAEGAAHQQVLEDWLQGSGRLSVHLFGSPWQLSVWEALLSVPVGRLVSYGALAGFLGRPKAARAVGAAVGSNRIACLVPCHRVVAANGDWGGYRWGVARKVCLILREALAAG